MRFRLLVSTCAATLLLQSSFVFAESALSEQKVAMRDGVELATDVHLPEGDGPWPCVLMRTPYGKNGRRNNATRFTDAGFAFVAQDCRGRHASAGSYRPFKDDHLDGYDTVEWVAAQSWSNGKVGMLGGSAVGMTTNLAATQTPPHLVCGFVTVAPASARRQTVYMGGVYRKELNDGWLTGMNAIPWIKDSVSNPAGSDYWDWREIPDFHHRMSIPMCNVGGWFDIFAQGALDNFAGLQEHGRGLAAGNQKLIMGPFGHGRLGGRLKFPNATRSDYGIDYQVRWFQRWLQGEDNGIDREPPVMYYLMGDTSDPEAPGNEWREASHWPPVAARPTSFFLAPELRLSNRPQEKAYAVQYVYDPKDPVPTVGGANLILGGKGPLDQRKISGRDDYLRFATEPLEQPVEVVGRVSVDLFVSSDAPDTDFVAKLVDVYPDGYEALIADGILRARYREGLDREVPLEEGVVVPVQIDLWSTAIVFNKGHRIAVHITSSNDPRFDPNPNTGQPLRANKETRPASNTIYFGPDHPSRLLLPVVPQAE